MKGGEGGGDGTPAGSKDGLETLRLGLALDDWRERADLLERAAEARAEDWPELATLFERFARAYDELHDAGCALLVLLAEDAGAEG
jgi:hypothetical protein